LVYLVAYFPFDIAHGFVLDLAPEVIPHVVECVGHLLSLVAQVILGLIVGEIEN
jgi:hypothetical protein